MKKLRGFKKQFVDKTSTAVPDDKTGKYPKIWLTVHVNSEIPMSHRICRWFIGNPLLIQQILEELCFILSLL